MEERRQDETFNRPEGDRVIDAPLVHIDLAQYIEQLRNEKAWQQSGRNAITVFKSEQLSIVLVAMHGGAEIKTRRPEHQWTAQVIEGRLGLSSEEKNLTLEGGQLAVLHGGVPYALRAEGESLVLLTVVGKEEDFNG